MAALGLSVATLGQGGWNWAPTPEQIGYTTPQPGDVVAWEGVQGWVRGVVRKVNPDMGTLVVRRWQAGERWDRMLSISTVDVVVR